MQGDGDSSSLARMRMRLTLTTLLALCCLAVPAWAAEDNEKTEKIKKLLATLNPQQGEVTISDGLAKLSVPENFIYFDTKGARTVLEDLWGNPPDPEVLGLIVPKGFNPFSEESWAVVITYDGSGYVKDKDADTIDYTKLMREMQKDTAESNKEREKQGYPAVDLVGWAAPPHYDKETKKLYWAQELSFAGEDAHTLNYSIRVLGRRGVLVLNAVAGMPQLAAIEQEMPHVIEMVNFQEGHRYVDFDPKLDKVAGYGLAALVAGGVAAKTGLFKGLLVALLAGKKFVVAGVVALMAFIGKMFKRKE